MTDQSAEEAALVTMKTIHGMDDAPASIGTTGRSGPVIFDANIATIPH